LRQKRLVVRWVSIVCHQNHLNSRPILSSFDAPSGFEFRFPRTQAQAKALEEAGITADCFLFLNVPDEVLVERVVGRRTDPETGKIYHMKFSPPDDKEVLARLQQRSDDTEEKVVVRLEQFHANVDAVKDSYTDISVVIDGNRAPSDVSNDIIAAIKSKASA
jgi:adenylate kinase